MASLLSLKDGLRCVGFPWSDMPEEGVRDPGVRACRLTIVQPLQGEIYSNSRVHGNRTLGVDPCLQLELLLI